MHTPNERADYLITAARFNTGGTHIEAVQARANRHERPGTATTATRAQVLSWTQAGWSFYTATPTPNGWRKGALVKIVVIDGEAFIRTKADNVKADDLDTLPRF